VLVLVRAPGGGSWSSAPPLLFLTDESEPFAAPLGRSGRPPAPGGGRFRPESPCASS